MSISPPTPAEKLMRNRQRRALCERRIRRIKRYLASDWETLCERTGAPPCQWQSERSYLARIMTSLHIEYNQLRETPISHRLSGCFVPTTPVWPTQLLIGHNYLERKQLDTAWEALVEHVGAAVELGHRILTLTRSYCCVTSLVVGSDAIQVQNHDLQRKAEITVENGQYVIVCTDRVNHEGAIRPVFDQHSRPDYFMMLVVDWLTGQTYGIQDL